MGLLDRIFKPPRDPEAAGGGAPAPSAFADSDGAQDETLQRAARRRELVQVVLRDTMRGHGIPSDWMDCRILPATSRRGRGMHLHLVVRKAHAQMLPHVLAFQNNFRGQLLQFDPRAGDWLLGLAWQFEGVEGTVVAAAPVVVPGAVAAPAGLALAADPPQAVEATEDDVQSDLEALFAIRDQAIAPPAAGDVPAPGFEPTRPGNF